MSRDESQPAALDEAAIELPTASAAAPSAPLRLDTFPLGSAAVLGAPDSMTPTVLRLLEMGFTPGTGIVLTRRAPGGDPIEVRVRGTRLCVRRDDLAVTGVVRPVAASRAPSAKKPAAKRR